MPIQINGKVRGKVKLTQGATKDEALDAANKDAVVSRYLEGKTVVKVVYVPEKILNLVIR